MSTVIPLPQPRGISAVVASELRVLMARYGQTQRDLAQLLGISQGQMSKRMKGTIAFDVTELQTIADRFNVTVADLVGGAASGHNGPSGGAPGGQSKRHLGGGEWASRGSNPQPTE